MPERVARTSDTVFFVAGAVLAEADGGRPFHAGTEISRSGKRKSKRRLEGGCSAAWQKWQNVRYLARFEGLRHAHGEFCGFFR
jgi:hypothetical protein